ncbi:hypothetical protein BgiMline_035533 [Biomphalaria glabrata]|nr:hypothetical protein BgiMline_030844 [Biomphalaria glabrata]
MTSVQLIIACFLIPVSVTSVCTECDPDIPSRETPIDWYRDNAILDKSCGPGKYINSQQQCVPCLQGTFMTAAMAKTKKYIFCTACFKVEMPDLEELVAECNSTRDAEIHCKADFYRGRKCECDWECLPCSICGIGSKQFLNYKKRDCNQFQDTVCCAEAEDTLDGDTCVAATSVATTTTKRVPTTTAAPAYSDVYEHQHGASGNNNNSAQRNQFLSKFCVFLGVLTLLFL